MTEPFDHLLEKYARLVVRVGVNVQPGQEVVIAAVPEQADAARAIAKEAYRAGASHVSIEYADPFVARAAVEHAPEDALGRVHEHQLVQAREWHETRPAMVMLTGNPHPGLMEGLSPERLAKSNPVELNEVLMPLVANNKLAWTTVGAPTTGWADSIGVADVAALWDAVATAMRLDEADPVHAWQEQVARLATRAMLLNERGFDRIRYRGPGTDLTIGLNEGSKWLGGTATSQDGVEFVPNMPTEEVYISPDWRRAEGTLRTTVPFHLASMGTIVEELELDLVDGEIRGARADRGEEAVRQQFDLIPRSRHLGEVAIVDADSAVARTGVTYKNMLFDENVGSHVAWGLGFAPTVEHGTELTSEQLLDAGVNQSGTHVDVVIGSPEVQIDGIHFDGSVVPVTRGNEFVLRD